MATRFRPLSPAAGLTRAPRPRGPLLTPAARGLVATTGLSPWPHTLGPRPSRPTADKDSAAGPTPRHKPTKPEPRLRAPACLTHRSPHASCRRGNPPPGPTDASWTSSHSQSRRLERKEEERLQQPDPHRRGPLLNSRGLPPLPPPQSAPCGPNQELKWRPRRGQGLRARLRGGRAGVVRAHAVRRRELPSHLLCDWLNGSAPRGLLPSRSSELI